MVGGGKKIILGVQSIVAAEIIGGAMELVRAATGDNVDLRSTGAAEFWSIAVAENLEFLDGINGGIYKNGVLGAYVVIVRAIDKPLVAVRGSAAERDIDARQEALVLRIEAFRDCGTRHQRR